MSSHPAAHEAAWKAGIRRLLQVQPLWPALRRLYISACQYSSASSPFWKYESRVVCTVLRRSCFAPLRARLMASWFADTGSPSAEPEFLHPFWRRTCRRPLSALLPPCCFLLLLPLLLGLALSVRCFTGSRPLLPLLLPAPLLLLVVPAEPLLRPVWFPPVELTGPSMRQAQARSLSCLQTREATSCDSTTW